MNIAVLILLLSQCNKARLALLHCMREKAEVSKRQYSSKAKGSNVHDLLAGN
jgi:hypothetical protein